MHLGEWNKHVERMGKPLTKKQHMRVKSMRCLWKKYDIKCTQSGNQLYVLWYVTCCFLSSRDGVDINCVTAKKYDGQKCPFHQLHYIDLIYPKKEHLVWSRFNIIPYDSPRKTPTKQAIKEPNKNARDFPGKSAPSSIWAFVVLVFFLWMSEDVWYEVVFFYPPKQQSDAYVKRIGKKNIYNLDSLFQTFRLERFGY